MALVVSPKNYNESYSVSHSVEGSQYPWKEYIVRKKYGYIDTDFSFNQRVGKLQSSPYEFIDSYIKEAFYRTRPYGPYYPFNMPLSLGAPGTENDHWERAAEHFYSNARQLKDVDLGVALAESKQTIGLVYETASTLARAYRQLKKGRINDVFSTLGLKKSRHVPYNLRGFGGKRVTVDQHRRQMLRESRTSAHLADFAASKWLELRYGWTPLLYDLYGAGELLDYLYSQNAPDVAIHGVYKWEGDAKSASTAYDHVGQSMCVYRYDQYYRITDRTAFNMSKMGLANPALIAWELVPFSFVVDWFLPIGSWVESFTSLNGLTRISGSRTKFTIVEGESFIGTSPYEFLHNAETKIVQMKREISNAPSVPLPRFDLIGRLNGKRVTDAIALLWKAFRG